MVKDVCKALISRTVPKFNNNKNLKDEIQVLQIFLEVNNSIIITSNHCEQFNLLPMEQVK